MPKVNNVIELQQYKSVVKPVTKWIPISDFLELDPVFCQRQTDFRKAKTKRLLKKKFFASHLDVAVFKYPNGEEVRGNGNTRAVCWREFVEEDLAELVPAHVNATIYLVKNDEEAKQLYYTFDSDESVEKAPDKITGVFRALGLSFNTAKIAKGNIGKSLQYCSAGRDSHPSSSRRLDWFEIIKDYKQELITIDKLKLKKHFDSHIICASLMMLKRHGVSNIRLALGLEQLNERRKGAQSPKTGTDGITYILEEWDTNKVFEQKGTDGISFPRQQDFLLYCFEKWMAEENVTKYRRPSEGKAPGRGRRQSTYETFWDNED
tara:strand:- start:555 stop:1514 length:960 start_codon:yes stop_codon:yes gene_type:complete